MLKIPLLFLRINYNNWVSIGGLLLNYAKYDFATENHTLGVHSLKEKKQITDKEYK